MTQVELKRAVRVWLAARGKTQVWLAGRLRFSESYVSTVLDGHRVPSEKFVERFERVTGIALGRSSESREVVSS